MFWTWCTSSSFQIIVGTMGLTGNFIAIPILLSKRMTSIFNRMLVFLSVFDNIFIACSLLESVRKNFGPWNEKIQTYSFAYFLYQLQSVAAVASIFTTVVLALERRLAVSKPIEYHNAVQVWLPQLILIQPTLRMALIISLKIRKDKLDKHIQLGWSINPLKHPIWKFLMRSHSYMNKSNNCSENNIDSCNTLRFELFTSKTFFQKNAAEIWILRRC